MGVYEMKDDAKNIEIINSILYSEVFRPSPSPFSTQKVTSCLLEETYHFLPLIDSCLKEEKIDKILVTSITLSSGKILTKKFDQFF